MKTNLMSVVGSILSAFSLTSCYTLDIPVGGGGHGPQGPMYRQQGPVYQHGGGPPPGYERPYGRPVTPPNTYGDAVGSRVRGFPPPGGYDPNFHYGGW